MYQVWYDNLKKYKIVIGIENGENMHSFYGFGDILRLLTSRIDVWDTDLKNMFIKANLEDKLKLKRPYLCELFARNIMAKNPVLQG